MFRRNKRAMSGRERKGMMIGLVVSGVTAWVFHSQSIDLPPVIDKDKAVQSSSLDSVEPLLGGPGMVAAINAVRPAVFDCYRAEFVSTPHREQVVIVEFWAKIGAEKGIVFNGAVPFRDSVSESFDGCVKHALFALHFKTKHPPGRQKITFPFAFTLSR